MIFNEAYGNGYKFSSAGKFVPNDPVYNARLENLMHSIKDKLEQSGHEVLIFREENKIIVFYRPID